MKEKIRVYIQLTKPGVLFGNVLTGAAGYLLAAAGTIDWWVFIAVITGMTLVVGSACVVNNYLDRDIDRVMKRTKKRPSVTGVVPPRHILIYGIILGLIGTAILYAWTNLLVVTIGLIGWITYVWLYGAWTKRTSVHGTLVGSISGALPIAGGYAAASGVVDMGLVLVFLVVFFWQFPEFYSISIYRRKEYAAAKIPLMSVVHGVRTTIVQIFIYTVLYVASTLLLVFYTELGYVYAVVMALFGLHWLVLGAKGLRSKHPEAWSRRMFKFSMINLLVFCAAISLAPLLP